MPTPNNLRDLANRLLTTTFRFLTTPTRLGLKRPPFQVPFRQGVQLQPNATGIKRTLMPQEITKESKIDMTGEDGFTILVSVVDPSGTSNKEGFTPIEAFYIYGNDKIDTRTGLAKEVGVVLSAGRVISNQNIARTTLVPTSDGKSVVLKFTKESVKGKQNIWGNTNITLQPTSGGWVNPLHYLQNPDLKNDKTGLPKELGDFPYNFNDKFGASYFDSKGPGFGTSNLILTTPASKVDGPKNDGINSRKEIYDYIVSSKNDNIRFGGYEQYDFLHILDRLSPLQNPGNISKDVYLASYIELKEHEDPVMFTFDLLIDFETSPLFNGAIIDFIDKNSEKSPEIAARKKIYQNFINQFRRFFKLKTSNDSTNIAQDDDQADEKIVPLPSIQKKDRTAVKAYYLKSITGLAALTEGFVSSNSDTVKSMISYGKDIIKLTLNEDLTLNTGYLAALYKMLTWSRLNGKQLIPENLLRFDCKIIVNEVRNYARLLKNANSIESYADDMNKYIYKLYDCQFIFDKLSHPDTINNWQITSTDDFDISFDYKYSTLSFEKYYSNRPKSIRKWDFDSSKVDPISYEEKNSATNLKPYLTNSPTAIVTTSDLTDAAIRTAQRQTDGGAEFANDISIPNVDMRGDFDRIMLAGASVQEAPPEYFSPLEDLSLIDSYRNSNRGAFDNYVESQETDLEKLDKIDRNNRLLSSNRNRSRRLDIGSTNRQTDLINRTLDYLIQNREYLLIGSNTRPV